MTCDFSQWESDPFFSAAEDVQDSADRMQSSFRTWLHEQCLVKKTPAALELAGSLKNKRRELLIAMRTVKWQLEDFQKSTRPKMPKNKAALNDESPSRHMQFILAIKNQINAVENALTDSSTNNINQVPCLVDSSDKDKDDLTSFFLGGRPPRNTMQSKQHHKSDFNDNVAVAFGKNLYSKNSVSPSFKKPPQSIPQTGCDTQKKTYFETGTKCYSLPKANSVQSDLSKVCFSDKDSELRHDSHLEIPVGRGTRHKRSASLGDYGGWRVDAPTATDDDLNKPAVAAQCQISTSGSSFLNIVSSLKSLFYFSISKSGMKKWKDGESCFLNRVNQEKSCLPVVSNERINSKVGLDNAYINGFEMHLAENSHTKHLGWTGAFCRKVKSFKLFIQDEHYLHKAMTLAAIIMLCFIVVFIFRKFLAAQTCYLCKFFMP